MSSQKSRELAEALRAKADEIERAGHVAQGDRDRPVTFFDCRQWAQELRALVKKAEHA